MPDRDILIEPDGTVRFVYEDDLSAVFDGEEARTVRASHVEPATTLGATGPGWLADMSPVGGPILFADGEWTKGPFLHREPFATRQAALDAERQWLREHLGL